MILCGRSEDSDLPIMKSKSIKNSECFIGSRRYRQATSLPLELGETVLAFSSRQEERCVSECLL